MSQATLTTPSSPLNMTALKTFLDNALAALVTVQRGDPAGISSPSEGMLVWDTTGATDILKRYTVAAGWVELFSCNITTGAVVPYKNGSEVTDSVPTGTKMWFYQNTAPTGWTIDATPADAVLAVKGGSQAFNANGGTQAGTWTQPNHTHTTGDVTLTAAQSGLPAHTHNILNGQQGTGAQPNVRAYLEGLGTHPEAGYIVANAAANAASAHNHGATGNGATANTWRPLAQLGIICTKD